MRISVISLTATFTNHGTTIVSLLCVSHSIVEPTTWQKDGIQTHQKQTSTFKLDDWYELVVNDLVL